MKKRKRTSTTSSEDDNVNDHNKSDDEYGDSSVEGSATAKKQTRNMKEEARVKRATSANHRKLARPAIPSPSPESCTVKKGAIEDRSGLFRDMGPMDRHRRETLQPPLSNPPLCAASSSTFPSVHRPLKSSRK